MTQRLTPAGGHPLATPDTATFGRYRLLGRLAVGGMAEVWAGELRGIGGFCKRVVVKRVRPELMDDPRFLGMFVTEARIAARLSHRNICEVFDLGEVDGELYMAMEYLRGASVRKIVRRTGRLSPALAVAIVDQAARGLEHAHGLRDPHTGDHLGIVHRDVSPENLFVTTDGTVKLLDFGIAKICDGLAAATEAGKTKGKLAYMAPEQLAAEPIDRQADVWSLGVVLWELLTGARLFQGPMHEVADRIHVGDVPNLAAHGVDHPALQAVIAQALRQDRRERFSSAEDLRVALRLAMPTEELDQAALLAILVRRQCRAEIAAAERVFATTAEPESDARPRRAPSEREPGDPAAPLPVPAAGSAPSASLASHRPSAGERVRPDATAKVRRLTVVAEPARPAGRGNRALLATAALAAALVLLGALALDQLGASRGAASAAVPASGASAPRPGR
ncbi:MAG: serine/threonine protein kinase [Myxococcales bacterium]|nr:serine/threonine protein kinase [Myxococcales bacterium]MBP6842615.1 serine/threonine protein kinase [Kofleriaceae bacterium]